jgi:hypothetical protein
VCIDFRDLHKATPMDGYLMPVVDALINTVVEAPWTVMLDITRYLLLQKIL